MDSLSTRFPTKRFQWVSGCITFFILVTCLAASCQAGKPCNFPGCQKLGRRIKKPQQYYQCPCGYIAPGQRPRKLPPTKREGCLSCRRITEHVHTYCERGQITRCEEHRHFGRPVQSQLVSGKKRSGSSAINQQQPRDGEVSGHDELDLELRLGCKQWKA
ncbi:hypothetical protein O181_030369 [Austropuccinia psidii MF-1]|uniref:Secreted protein n=1 Tax=Austropuccinia psidii MF-1 TaxID=1389203 RepID=A0A9Q3CTX8_9BASI|nr:hypothetical protein [Austropuccinia psidii MF-1]